MPKTLCEWSRRDIERHCDQLQKLTHAAEFYCRKCARVAVTERVLCKPEAFRDCPSQSRD